jgi:hypothetical protein
MTASRLAGRGGRGQGSDERESRLAGGAREVSVPLLALLADVDGVEQIGAGELDRGAAQGPKVRDGQRLFGGLGQEEEADGRVGGRGELLELFQGGLRFTGDPFGELGEALGELLQVPAGAVDRPGEELRIDLDSHHHISRNPTNQARMRHRVMRARVSGCRDGKACVGAEPSLGRLQQE